MVEVWLNRQIGKTKNNFPRKLAMYLCQIYAQNTLSHIQNVFNLKSIGSVGNAIYSVKKELSGKKYREELCLIKELLYVVQ